MRDSLKWTAGWLWVLVYLALPDCSFAPAGFPPPNFDRGPQPRGSVIFCDIEQVLGRHCATPTDKIIGIRLSQAAVALVERNSSNIGLDYSPEALGRCGGEPEAVTFKCLFPAGCALCVKCIDVIGSGATYANVDAACAAHCEDIFGPVPPEVPPDPLVIQFCEQHSHASTNSPLDDCFGGACTAAGTPRGDFVDPRRTPEAVLWTDAINVDVNLNSLARTVASTGQFDAGAASQQLITRGDGYVEFTATETDRARICGLSVGFPPDSDPRDVDISFGVRLTFDGHIFISENGTLFGPLAPYVTGDRIRVTVTDNFDGTANIAYILIPAACTGAGCGDRTPLRTAGPAPYPFRVDASLRDQGATLTDVRIVRIK